MSVAYADFIEAKHKRHKSQGMDPGVIHDSLNDFQKATVRWALKKGKACIFAGTGLGKTRMQLEYARHIPGRRLIAAPLAVSDQTIEEAEVIGGMEVHKVRSADDIKGDGVYIVNYDRLHLLDDIEFNGVILDESSIIKSHDGHFRNYITQRFWGTEFKLACTATPSPNDYMELATHAEFMGAMTRQEMLATFFTHDGADTSKWRLKGHAKRDFWTWVASWAAVYSHPRDIGFDQPGYDLPDLIFRDHIVDVESTIQGGLFGDSKVSATQVYKVLRESAGERAELTAEIVKGDDSPCIVWCNSDDEQNRLEKLIPNAASVRGSQLIEVKESGLRSFSYGTKPTIITKPKIAGYGLNWQHCNRMIFCGVTYSFEQVYQAIRRSWRFGQTKPVTVHFVTCNAQESIKSSLKAKEEAFKSMASEVKKYCAQELMGFN